MRRMLVVGEVVAALVGGLVGGAPGVGAAQGPSGGYIVVLKGAADPAAVAGGRGPRSRTCTGMR